MTPRELRFRSAVPAVAVIAVLVLPVLWWLKVAFVDPETEMLAPSTCGRWVVHPEWDLELESIERPGPVPFIEQESPPVIYRLDLPAEALAADPVAEITVMGAFRVALGNRSCGSFAADRGWKRPVEVDLGACLDADSRTAKQPRGHIPLVIQARNLDGPAPARVCWQRSDPSLPATGFEGWIALTAKAGPRPAALAGREMSELSGKDFTWPNGPWGYRAFLASMGLLALVGLLRKTESDDNQWSKNAGRVTTGLVLALVVAVYSWNGLSYPWEASRVDQAAHRERLLAAADGNWLPPAHSMFQAYQPPVYYALGGALLAMTHPDMDTSGGVDAEVLRPVQILDSLAGIAHAFLVWLVLRRFGPASVRARVLALAVVTLAPVAVTTHPMLGNESFSGFLCGAALVAGLLWVPRGRPALAAAAGVVGGLALLSKFTGLMPAAAVGLVLGVRWLYSPADAPPRPSLTEPEPVAKMSPELVSQPQRRSLASPVIWALVIVLLSGPFYVDRWIEWGDPFIGNWSRTLGYGGEAEPGYRTVGFFLRFGEVFFHAPERGMWSSFWDGLYASTWGEINDSFVPIRDDAVNAVLLMLLALAVVPTLAWISGFAQSVRRAFRGPPGVDLAFVAVTMFTVSSVAVFTTRVPFANTVKAIFLLSLLVPAAHFVARGYARMERGLGRARWLLDLVTGLQLLLVLHLFVWRV